jgi:hypothetical protein
MIYNNSINVINAKKYTEISTLSYIDTSNNILVSTPNFSAYNLLSSVIKVQGSPITTTNNSKYDYSFQGLPSWTVEFWVKPFGPANQYDGNGNIGCILDSRSSSVLAPGITFWLSLNLTMCISDNSINNGDALIGFDNGTNTLGGFGYTLNDNDYNKWYHYAVTYSSDVFSLFVNGIYYPGSVTNDNTLAYLNSLETNTNCNGTITIGDLYDKTPIIMRSCNYSLSSAVYDREIGNSYNMDTDPSFTLNKFNGMIGPVRISSNVRYTTNFTPAYSYTSDANTLFILGSNFNELVKNRNVTVLTKNQDGSNAGYPALSNNLSS